MELKALRALQKVECKFQRERKTRLSPFQYPEDNELDKVEIHDEGKNEGMIPM